MFFLKIIFYNIYIYIFFGACDFRKRYHDSGKNIYIFLKMYPKLNGKHRKEGLGGSTLEKTRGVVGDNGL